VPEQIPRATTSFSREDFQQLVELTTPRQWLRRKSTALFDLWSLLDCEEKKSLIVELIQRFRVLDIPEVEDLCEHIRDHLISLRNSRGKTTIIVASSDDAEADGSQMALQLLKGHFAGVAGWSERNFRNSMKGYDDYLLPNRSFVLFDDFIGTGSKIVRKFRSFASAIASRNLTSCDISVISIAAMTHSRKLLDAEGISYYSPLWTEKGIDAFNEKSIAESKRSMMRSIETNLAARVDGQYLPGLGYKGSQALFSIGGVNCPNNVFPVFWWTKHKDRSARETIMKRLR
jgi:hypothetical protein